jgi:hypothetical protein
MTSISHAKDHRSESFSPGLYSPVKRAPSTTTVCPVM